MSMKRFDAYMHGLALADEQEMCHDACNKFGMLDKEHSATDPRTLGVAHLPCGAQPTDPWAGDRGYRERIAATRQAVAGEKEGGYDANSATESRALCAPDRCPDLDCPVIYAGDDAPLQGRDKRLVVPSVDHGAI